VIDRFSARAGHLLVRDHRPDLPAPGSPIDLDRQPFVTQGLAPDGRPVRYYNFDIQSDRPATLYRFRRGAMQVAGQPDVVDRIPGDDGYNDFWRVAWVDVPADFVPGSITAASQVHALPISPSTIILDCPIVPRGSHGAGAPAWLELAYRGERVACLHFGDDLTAERDRVPTSPIYVTFASEAGPDSGFRTEPRTPQTHNVVMSVPGDADYSPLWAVHIYDRAAFDRVHDATSALAAPLADKGPLVNCPIIAIGPF
jgi:hypothetical protein